MMILTDKKVAALREGLPMSTSILSLDLLKYEEDLHLSMESSVEAEAVQAQLGKELPSTEDHKSVLKPQEGVSYAIVTPNSAWAVVLSF